MSRRVAHARLALAQTLGSQGVVDADPTIGTLRFVGRLDGFLTGPSARPAETVAMDYVRLHLAAFSLSRSDLRTFHLRNDYVDIIGTHHLSWVQRVGGVEAFPNGLKANVTRDGRLINVSGSPAASLNAPTTSPRLDATAAIAAARAAAWGTAVRDADEAELALFPTARGGRLAWRTTTWVGDDALLSLIDAESGDVLWRMNLARSDTTGTGVAFDYFPGANVPNGGGVEHAVSFPVIDGTGLSGNNAHVFADTNDNGVADAVEEIAASSGVNWNYPVVLDSTTAAENCSLSFPCTWDKDLPFSWQQNRNHF